MPELVENTLADTIKARVADRLHWLNLTPITAATKNGLPRDSIRNLFRRDSALPRADTLAEIADALETTVSYLMGETANPGVEKWSEEAKLDEVVRLARPVPVRSALQDGAREPHSEPIGYLDLNVPGYDTSELNAFQVADDAMSDFYETGRFVVTAPVGQIGLQFGDHIVAMRMAGEKVETILREYAQGPAGPELVSRSDGGERPPIRISDLKKGEMMFGGVVVADFKLHDRQILPPAYVWPDDEGG